MDENHGPSHISDSLRHQIVAAISKHSGQRTYDDLLLLKSYMLETEFFEKSQLGNANPRQVNDLCRGIELEVHKVGEVVFNQGDIGDKVYIILFGKVEFIARFTIDLTQGQTEIREKKLDTFSSGRIFGERALQFDEPRSATAQCVEETYLITVEKTVYLRVLEDVRQDRSVNFRPDQLKTDQVSRETVMAILGKKREKRTHQELEAAALYLCNRTKVESFQKLTMAQVVEVCRVAETLTIWGKSMVCKQGEVGPVFYAVLSGSVEVWVSKEMPTALPVRTGSRHHDITEGLGRMENQLVTGKTFGDRALTAMDSLRKASIVTCEDATELLVIFRKDYENLIAATSQVETMAKIRLLRKTDLFHNLDMIHLRALANVMETRTYGIDETVVMVAKRATDVIIVERGEMTVLTEVLEGFSRDNYDDMIAQQSYHHYLEDKHHHSHLTDDGRPIPDAAPVDYNHDKLKKMPVKKNELLEMSKQESQKNMQAKLQRMPSTLRNTTTTNSAGSMGFGKNDLNGNSTSTYGSNNSGQQPFESAVRESNSPTNGRVSSQERKRNPRFQSTQLVPLGKRKKVTLGRIAPNSVLATYVMTCATQHDEVYHPETIIATTLVNAYTISKHAFFTSLPKDSKYAIVKIVKDYKPPILTSLWENVPRVLDETQWKMEKTWKNFKNRFMEHGHKANILDSHKRMEHLHISVNSGNDPEVKLMPRHYQFMNQNKDHGGALAMAILDPSKRKQEVNMEWGLPAHKRDPGNASPIAAAAANAMSDFNSSIEASTPKGSDKRRKSTSPHPTHGSNQLNDGNQHHNGHHHHHHHHHHHDDQHTDSSAVILAPTLSSSVSTPMLQGQYYSGIASQSNNANKAEPLVSFRIRERLNLSRSMNALSEKQMSALTASHSETALLRNHQSFNDMSGTNGHGRNGGNSSPGKPSASSGMKGGLKKSKVVEMPFTLIQIHRELSKRNAVNLASTTRRPVKSYLRVCGSFASCAKAKELADLQMEQHYLTLYHSEASKEEELLLNWQTFKGYETMALDASDHFFIYCRSTPVEFASLRPTKNIFNVRFPAMCKPQSQRYAVLLVNPLPPSSLEQMKRAQQQQMDENPGAEEENSSDEDENNNNNNSSNQKGKKFMVVGGKRIPMKALGVGVAAFVGLDSAAGNANNANGTSAMAANAAPTTGMTMTTGVSNNSMNAVDGADITTGGNNGGVATLDKDGKPMHFSELSIIQETIAITSTRLDGLRYAIDHFGRVIPAKTTVSVNGISHRLPPNSVPVLSNTLSSGGTVNNTTFRSAAAASDYDPTTTSSSSSAAGAASNLMGGLLTEEEAALHAAIMSTPADQLDPQQQQLQEMLLATFVASQQMMSVYHQNEMNQHDTHTSSSGAHRSQAEFDHHMTQAAMAGKRRLGNRSVFISPEKMAPQSMSESMQQSQLLSNDPNITQSMALGAITVVLKPLPSSSSSSSAAAASSTFAGTNNGTVNALTNNTTAVGNSATGNNSADINATGSSNAAAGGGVDVSANTTMNMTNATNMNSTAQNMFNSSSGMMGAAGTSASDRVLRLLHLSFQQHAQQPAQRLRVCVLPLFRWILVDNPTLDILDFTKAFHEDAIKNIFLAEQEEYLQQQRQLATSPRSGQNSRANSRQSSRSRQPKRTSVPSYANQPDQGYNEEDDNNEDENDYNNAEVFEFHANVHHSKLAFANTIAGNNNNETSNNNNAAWVKEVNQYRDFTRELLDNKELPPQLLSSMSAAGLLPKKTAKAVAVRFSGDNSHSQTQNLNHTNRKPNGNGKMKNQLANNAMLLLSTNNSITSANSSHRYSSQQLLQQQSSLTHDLQPLQILQQEIASQEIASQLQQLQFKQSLTMTPQQFVETDPLINSFIDPSIAQDHNSVYHVAGGHRMSAIDKEIEVTGQQLTQTMAQLQQTIAQTGQALEVHDKLCDLEYATHHRFQASQSAVAQQKSLEMLNRRMDVIEGFQQLVVTPSQPAPVTLFALYQQQAAANNSNGGNSHAASTNNSTAGSSSPAKKAQRGLISAKYLNNNNSANNSTANGTTANSSGNTNANTTGTAGGATPSTLSGSINVAKRLNDTLKTLSESIDGPYKKQQQELLRLKELEQQEKLHRQAKLNSVPISSSSIAANVSSGTGVTSTNNPDISSASNNNNNNSTSSIGNSGISFHAAASAALVSGMMSANNNNNFVSNSSASSVVSGNNSLPSLSKQVSQSSLGASI